MKSGQTHNLMTAYRSHYKKDRGEWNILWHGWVADFCTQSTNIFQAWTAFLEIKIENTSPISHKTKKKKKKSWQFSSEMEPTKQIWLHGILGKGQK